MKRLFLCRHAKSDWSDSTLADIERPLTDTGKSAAAKIGQRLADRGIYPDLILASPAKRAFGTAAILAREVEYPQENIVVNDTLYGAAPEELLNIIRRSDNSCNTVYLVGHNPAITLLTNYFGVLTMSSVPTTGIVALEFNVNEWEKIDQGNCSLLFFDYPDREVSKEIP